MHVVSNKVKSTYICLFVQDLAYVIRIVQANTHLRNIYLSDPDALWVGCIFIYRNVILSVVVYDFYVLCEQI